MSREQEKAQELLNPADVRINGMRPWDIRVYDERFYRRVFAQGALGLGESFMDRWWDCERLDDFSCRILSTGLSEKARPLSLVLLALKSKLLNLQTKRLSRQVARGHYDLGNDLFESMLDKNMQYTCAYWKEARDLDQAQIDKLHLISRKLALKPGMRVLELGGGFGGLARFMAREYGCEVVSYNISAEQVKYAREICRGLPVTLVEADYRDATGLYDRVAAIGLCEHVGHKNYRGFMELVHRCLKEDGLFLLHTIGGNQSVTSTDPWTDKYVFPNGMMPSAKQLGAAMEGLFVMEDWHNFGPDYDKTLMAWWANFDSAWPKLEPKYGPRFYRMWKYYLQESAGAFRARKLQVWQIVLSKGNIRYQSVR